MLTTEKFRVNYFVGGGLAQGGELWIDGAKIVFSPTSALDRAMGAKEVEITFEQVRGLDYAGSLSRSFLIKTEAKSFKFEGGQAKRVWEALDKAMMAKKINRSALLTASLACDGCTKKLESYFTYCPYCAQRVKSICKSCRKTVDPTWAACASCGWKFTNAQAA